MDRYVKAVSNSDYHGLDISLLILAKMLKIVIAVIHPDYLWMLMPDVNVHEASVVVLIYDGDRFIGTGTSPSLLTDSKKLLCTQHSQGIICSMFNSTHH